MAAHSFGGGEHDSAGPGQRQRAEWRGHLGHDTGVVRVRAVYHRYDWVVDYDFEY